MVKILISHHCTLPFTKNIKLESKSQTPINSVPDTAIEMNL